MNKNGEKGQVQEILCGKIGHDLLMAKEKKGKAKDNFVSCGQWVLQVMAKFYGIIFNSFQTEGRKVYRDNTVG